MDTQATAQAAAQTATQAATQTAARAATQEIDFVIQTSYPMGSGTGGTRAFLRRRSDWPRCRGGCEGHVLDNEDLHECFMCGDEHACPQQDGCGWPCAVALPPMRYCLVLFELDADGSRVLSDHATAEEAVQAGEAWNDDAGEESPVGRVLAVVRACGRDHSGDWCKDGAWAPVGETDPPPPPGPGTQDYEHEGDACEPVPLNREVLCAAHYFEILRLVD